MVLHVVLSLATAGLVLCVGEDGHAAVESRFDEDCCTGDPMRLGTLDVCQCIDAPLLQPAATLAAADAPAVVTAPVLDEPPRSDGPSARSVAYANGRARGSGPPGLSSLRTIVLLV